jgi:hypothetical protein
MVGRMVRIVAWLLLWTTMGHLWFKQASLQQFRAAHKHDYVLLGDSHADDVPWEGRPRFSGPAQDLFSTLKRVEALAQTRTDSSALKGVVMTFWPNKFSPLAERRMSGGPLDDNWVGMALGSVAPLWGWRDALRQDLPWRFRAQIMWHMLQFKTTLSFWDTACESKSVDPAYQYGLTEVMKTQDWWSQATIGPAMMEDLIDHVISQGWTLVLIENPLHPTYYRQVNKQALQGYESALASWTAHPQVHALRMGRDNLDHTWFRDYHHLTCEGERAVGDALEAFLQELDR